MIKCDINIEQLLHRMSVKILYADVKKITIDCVENVYKIRLIVHYRGELLNSEFCVTDNDTQHDLYCKFENALVCIQKLQYETKTN